MKGPLSFRRLVPISVAILISLVSVVSPESQEIDDDMPAWALYERGLELLPSADDAVVPAGPNDPGEALRMFRRAIARREEELKDRGEVLETEASLFPEAEAGLAEVYQLEGNLALAERHYLRALESSAFLAIPETEWELRYELADVYEMSQRRRLAQQEWLTIVEDVDDIDSQETRELLENYRRIFWEEGIDRLLQLYRQEGSASIAANRNLGRQYLGMGRYEASFEHDIIATVKIVTIIVEEIRRFRPLYRLETLGATLSTAEEYPQIVGYLNDSGLFDTLERLAQASFRLQNSSLRSRELWELVATYAPPNSLARRKATDRAAAPDTDPLVVPR
ncbi:MAG: tetratricopeptide repeat protein [Spirochaetota bacterium]